MRDGLAVVETCEWKEKDGKFYYNSGIEGDIMGEEVDPYVELEFDNDGCMLYNFGMLALEKM